MTRKRKVKNECHTEMEQLLLVMFKSKFMTWNNKFHVTFHIICHRLISPLTVIRVCQPKQCLETQ